MGILKKLHLTDPDPFGLFKMFKTGSKASDEATAQEAARQAKLTADQKRIEGIFSSPQREQQIQDFIAAQRGYLQSDLDRTHGDNERNLKFANARSGLSFGSVDADSNTRLSELYLRGVGEAERRAQNSGSQLRADDQSSKQQLMSQILGGADATTAAQNAAQMMRNNANLAGQDSTFNSFDTLFKGFGSIYKDSKEAAGERRASQEFGSLFGPRQKTQAQVSGGIYG
jgi:hypothetical protein